MPSSVAPNPVGLNFENLSFSLGRYSDMLDFINRGKYVPIELKERLLKEFMPTLKTFKELTNNADENTIREIVEKKDPETIKQLYHIFNDMTYGLEKNKEALYNAINNSADLTDDAKDMIIKEFDTNLSNMRLTLEGIASDANLSWWESFRKDHPDIDAAIRHVGENIPAYAAGAALLGLGMYGAARLWKAYKAKKQAEFENRNVPA